MGPDITQDTGMVTRHTATQDTGMVIVVTDTDTVVVTVRDIPVTDPDTQDIVLDSADRALLLIDK